MNISSNDRTYNIILSTVRVSFIVIPRATVVVSHVLVHVRVRYRLGLLYWVVVTVIFNRIPIPITQHI